MCIKTNEIGDAYLICLVHHQGFARIACGDPPVGASSLQLA